MKDSNNYSYKRAYDVLNSLVYEQYKTKKDAYDLVLLFANYLEDDSFKPDLKQYEKSSVGLRRAGYLIDFLYRFLDVDKEKKRHLKSELDSTLILLSYSESPESGDEKKRVAFFRGDTPVHLSLDSVADRWGLEAGLHPSQFKSLLDLQRRHKLGRA